jgi:hypothetical protein
LRALEEILELYERPVENNRPVVCFDEKSVELHAEVRAPIPVQPHHAYRRDYEYERCGTRNVFLFVAPKIGQRHTLRVRKRITSRVI